jgi:hypothetical protein
MLLHVRSLDSGSDSEVSRRRPRRGVWSPAPRTQASNPHRILAGETEAGSGGAKPRTGRVVAPHRSDPSMGAQSCDDTAPLSSLPRATTIAAGPVPSIRLGGAPVAFVVPRIARPWALHTLLFGGAAVTVLVLAIESLLGRVAP